MSEVVIYGIPKSTYVQSARWAFAEKGLETELTWPDDASLTSEAYLARHPFGKIPTMVHGDVTIFEAAAICQYADEAFDGPALQPDDVVERAQMQKWVSVCTGYLEPVILKKYFFAYTFADGDVDQDVIDEALPDAKRYLTVLDKALEGRDFLAADHLTLAELLIGPMLAGFGLYKEGAEMLAQMPNLARAHKGWVSRPSFAEACSVPKWAENL